MLGRQEHSDRRELARKRVLHAVVVKGKPSSMRISKAKPISVNARTCNASFRGLGLELSAAAEWITGANVKIELKLNGRRVELPARICWTQGTRIGVRVFLELLDQTTRMQYLRWVAS